MDHEKQPAKRDPRLWIIIVALSLVRMLAAFETTIVTTSLPTIAAELQLEQNSFWLADAYLLTGAALLPLFGQLANQFGRRWLASSIVSIYCLGSGLSGGASSGIMLFVGRAIQGIGGGSINMIADVIVSDLVPLRERGGVLAMMLGLSSLGLGIGPLAGGLIVQNSSWRWIFYLNLPIGGVALLMLVIFLNVQYDDHRSLRHKLGSLDYGGNILLISGTVAIQFGVSSGGVQFAWSDWRVLLPTILGAILLVLFCVYERSVPREPVLQPRIYQNRTSVVALLITFLNSALLTWIVYFLPVYFQGVRVLSPKQAGTRMLALILVAIPCAILASILLTKWGRYRPLHLFGSAASTVAIAMLALLTPSSSEAICIVAQVLGGFGAGMILNTTLIAVQAPLSEELQAAATSTNAFIFNFGKVWGVVIPAALFNSRCGALAYSISAVSVRAVLESGRAYQHATRAFIMSLDAETVQQLVGVYAESLRTVWLAATVCSAMVFCLAFCEKEIPLRTKLETKYGMRRESSSRET